MNQKDLINRLISEGWITFNPFTMEVLEPRYTVILGEEKHEIQDTDITELVAELLIRAEYKCPYPMIDKFKNNAWIDVYALETFAEVTWQLSFATMKELRNYKKVAEVETLYYYDQNTQESKEL